MLKTIDVYLRDQQPTFSKKLNIELRGHTFTTDVTTYSLPSFTAITCTPNIIIIKSAASIDVQKRIDVASIMQVLSSASVTITKYLSGLEPTINILQSVQPVLSKYIDGADALHILSSAVLAVMISLTTSDTLVIDDAINESVEKHFDAESIMYLWSELIDVITKHVDVDNELLLIPQMIVSVMLHTSTTPDVIEIDSDAHFSLGRNRWLYEMDDDTLSVYDNMELTDVDYIVLAL